MEGKPPKPRVSFRLWAKNSAKSAAALESYALEYCRHSEKGALGIRAPGGAGIVPETKQELDNAVSGMAKDLLDA
jgi:hypothetical protein